jgi:hypothetical protein
MQFFGYKITRDTVNPGEQSFIAPQEEGAVDSIRGGGHFGTYLDMDAAVKSDAELVKKYREVSLHADVDIAIQDIVDEAIANLDDEEPVRINLEKTVFSDSIKKVIDKEFRKILDILQFNLKAQDYFRRWYIDGKIFFHKVIDTANPGAGIKDIRYIDPRKIKKIREVKKKRDEKTGIDMIVSMKEYFIYNDQGIWATRVTPHISSQSVRIEKDAIAYTSSGIVDVDNNLVLSNLHKAIKNANQLRMMENALVIYRLARAPERRIFYVDVGNLPKTKAEQYLRDVMNRYRNKIVYDSATGEIRDDKKFMSVLEDIWLPRTASGRTTEVKTLPGGENLGEITDIEYFQKQLYLSLNVPFSRFKDESGGLNFGKASEISRDELKFAKFVNKLRKRFAMLFMDLLKTQLLLKRVVTEQDWIDNRERIFFDFATDAYYEETKEQEMIRSRLEILTEANNFVGVYFSKDWVMKNILRFSKKEVDDMEKEMQKEVSSGKVVPKISDVMSSADIPPEDGPNAPSSKK